MAFAAFGLFAFCVKAMRIFVIEVMNIAGQIISPMTLNAIGFLTMALTTPNLIDISFVAVLMTPIRRMDIAQRNAGAVA